MNFSTRKTTRLFLISKSIEDTYTLFEEFHYEQQVAYVHLLAVAHVNARHLIAFGRIIKITIRIEVGKAQRAKNLHCL